MDQDGPSPQPFDRFSVIGYRIEQGNDVEQLFFVYEIDLPNDDLAPIEPPPRCPYPHTARQLGSGRTDEPGSFARR